MLLSDLGSIGALPEERINAQVSRRIANGKNAMIVWWKMKPGASVAPHAHPHEQIVWVLSGKMEIRIGDKRHVCGPGDFLLIPSGIEHEGVVLEDTEVVDIFSPPREDFLAGQMPSYMSRK